MSPPRTEPRIAPMVRGLLPDGRAGRELVARVCRALGDPTRLDLVGFLIAREATGTQCVDRAGLSQGRVSAHLACLVACGLATVRREGRSAHYRVSDPRVVEIVRMARELAADHAASIAACMRVDADAPPMDRMPPSGRRATTAAVGRTRSPGR